MRFRLHPTAQQEEVLVGHCAHARYVWNLALEQANCWRRETGPTPNAFQRCRQLTEARAAFDWLAAGSVMVQQQALRDFDQAMRNWWAGSHRRPTWRKAGANEGFRRVDLKPHHIIRLNRRWGKVLVPKCGWVRFRWTRQPPPGVKSFRVTLDRSGRWHMALACKPEPLAGPGDGSVVGVDRGVAATLALSNGSTFCAPAPSSTRRLARGLSNAQPLSNRRRQAKLRLARAMARDTDARKDFVEKTSTLLARSYDLIRIEDLRIANMTRSARGTAENPGRNVRAKAALNRAILAQGWGMFARRLEDKAPGRVEKVNPAFTSQRCSVCGHVDSKSRKSQAIFECTACSFTGNADVNAARNIAAGHAVTARRGLGVVDLPLNREPQLALTG